MRNIAIADRRDWVFEAPKPQPPRGPAPRQRLRNVLATLPILLLIPALLLPFVGVLAAGPRLTVTPHSPVANKNVKVVGAGFDPGVTVVVRWDGRPRVRVTTDADGRFKVKFKVPKGAKDGTHTVKATSVGEIRVVLARLKVQVGDQPAKAEAKAKATPKPKPADGAKATPKPKSTPKPPKPADAPKATATPTTAPAPEPPVVKPPVTPPSDPSDLAGALYSAATVDSLPTSGTAWAALKAQADKSLGTPNISDQDENTDVYVLAAGLVYARTGETAYRTKAIAAIKAAVETENGGRTLALARNLPGYVLAANLVDLPGVEPAFNENTFKPWLRSLLTENLDGQTLRSTHERRPNNWGTHAGAARVAIALYLGDDAELARAAAVFHGWLGDRAAYAGFEYGDVSWQCDPSKPVGINPDCTKDGHAIGGALPDDMRRGASFAWPPAATGYPWEALQGALLQAELLRRAGYDTWNWEDKALLRASEFLYDGIGWAASGDDEWQPWMIDARYHTSYRDAPPARYGKNFGWTDWLYGS